MDVFVPIVSPVIIPCPPNKYKLFEESIHEAALSLAPGVLLGSGTPILPYSPGWSASFVPDIQVQLFPSNFHRSFKYPLENKKTSECEYLKH